MLVDEWYSLSTFAHMRPFQVHKLRLEEKVIFFQLRYVSWEIPVQSRLIFRNAQSGQMGSKPDYSQGTLVWELIFKMLVYKWLSTRSHNNSLNFQVSGCPQAWSYHYILPLKYGYLESYFSDSFISDQNRELQAWIMSRCLHHNLIQHSKAFPFAWAICSWHDSLGLWA